MAVGWSGGWRGDRGLWALGTERIIGLTSFVNF
jgi:hypothetical protein